MSETSKAKEVAKDLLINWIDRQMADVDSEQTKDFWREVRKEALSYSTPPAEVRSEETSKALPSADEVFKNNFVKEMKSNDYIAFKRAYPTLREIIIKSMQSFADQETHRQGVDWTKRYGEKLTLLSSKEKEIAELKERIRVLGGNLHRVDGEHCPTCGSAVKVVGDVTKHYEPISDAVEFAEWMAKHQWDWKYTGKLAEIVWFADEQDDLTTTELYTLFKQSKQK